MLPAVAAAAASIDEYMDDDAAALAVAAALLAAAAACSAAAACASLEMGPPFVNCIPYGVSAAIRARLLLPTPWCAFASAFMRFCSPYFSLLALYVSLGS